MILNFPQITIAYLQLDQKCESLKPFECFVSTRFTNLRFLHVFRIA